MRMQQVSQEICKIALKRFVMPISFIKYTSLTNLILATRPVPYCFRMPFGVAMAMTEKVGESLLAELNRTDVLIYLA